MSNPSVGWHYHLHSQFWRIRFDRIQSARSKLRSVLERYEARGFEKLGWVRTGKDHLEFRMKRGDRRISFTLYRCEYTCARVLTPLRQGARGLVVDFPGRREFPVHHAHVFVLLNRWDGELKLSQLRVAAPHSITEKDGVALREWVLGQSAVATRTLNALLRLQKTKVLLLERLECQRLECRASQPSWWGEPNEQISGGDANSQTTGTLGQSILRGGEPPG